MLHTSCGLDFGTSNSTIGVGRQLVPLDAGRPIIRSAIFCDAEEKRWVFGQDGVSRYLDGNPGRLMMALKSILGSPLMADETLIFNEFVSYSQIIGHFIKHLKAKAEEFAGHELTDVIMGRPVHFHDTNPQIDQLAQQTLENIARSAGFKHIAFQYEPIAAALTYEATLTSEQLALIVDMGGGTSDFTIIRLQPNTNRTERKDDVLANCGIHVAGTDFDQSLSLEKVMPLLGKDSMTRGLSGDLKMPASIYHDLTLWHMINQLYTPKYMADVRRLFTTAHNKDLVNRLLNVLTKHTGHQLLQVVEQTKQLLSDAQETQINLNFIETALQVLVKQSEFNHCIAEHIRQIINKIHDTVTAANIKHEDITAIFYTGGSSKLPIIRQQINALFPRAEVVQGDAFGSVGMGLAIEADGLLKA